MGGSVLQTTFGTRASGAINPVGVGQEMWRSGGLVAPPCWERASMSETFALATLVPLRNAQISNLKKGGIPVLVQPREVCCRFFPGVGFHLRFLLSLTIDRIPKSQFT